MRNLEIIKYLQNNTIEQLVEEYKLIARQSVLFPELWLFKYSIKSDMTQQICQECRGIIINVNTMEIVAETYHKFSIIQILKLTKLIGTK